MTSTLFVNGTVRTLVERVPLADWLLVEDDVITGCGSRDDSPAADRTIDLDGGVLVPAFCDAHVHLPATGLYASGMDFRGERSARKIVEAFAARSRSREGVLFGGNFEDPLDGPLSRRELDAAVGDKPALLARADMHSAIVSTALLDNLDVRGLEGVDIDSDGTPSGYLREKAAGKAWRWFETNLPRHDLAGAVRTAVRLAYGKGISAVHEMYVIEWRGWSSFDILAEVAADVALDVTPYVATTNVERVREVGLDRVGGDLYLDGSFGSHSAWLSAPYESAPPRGTPRRGISYRDDDELVAFFSAAQRAGMQAGVHAIGDAAIEQALRCWEVVAADLGLEPVRALRHRIEHFECSSDDHIARAVRLGLGASVQPAFDHFWGGRDGLYAGRIGWPRAAGMNRFRTMTEAGLEVGAGSDSTVTPLDPFLQMAALRSHHLDGERLEGLPALKAHTLGAHTLARREDLLGSLEPNKRADLAWLDRDPVEATPEDLLDTLVAGTWIAGTRVWPEGEAEGD